MNPYSLHSVVMITFLLSVTQVGSKKCHAQILFEDDLAASSSSNWFDLGTFDTIFEFGYDYSLDGIPPAPRGSDTMGLKLEANTLEGFANEIALVHGDPAFTGQYTVQVDIWNNWFPNPGNVGTTEYTGAGVGHDTFVVGRNGALLLFDGDGDSSRDYRLYKDGAEQFVESNQYAIETTNNTNPILVEAFPGFEISEAVPLQGISGAVPDGAAGFQWMTLTIEVDTQAVGVGISQDPGLATFKLTSARSGNTVTIGTLDNSNGGTVVNMEGSVALFMADIFTSVSPSPLHSFGLFDNVLVTAGIEQGGSELVGDYNESGQVEQGDLDLVLLNWGLDGSVPPAGWVNDLPMGLIDQAELDPVLLNWGTQAARVVGAAGVPEPSTLMIGAGMILVWAAASFRRICERGVCT